jgi:thiol-disulfide isomerase/thioredoxin
MVAAAIVVMTLGLVMVPDGNARTPNVPAATSPLPPFELRDQHGALVTNEALLGRNWIVNVWASWCPPCRAELPLLARVAADLEGHGVGLLLVNAGEPRSTASSFLEGIGLTAPTLVDPDLPDDGLETTLSVLRRWRATGLPTTYFVDADGGIVVRHVGELTPDLLADQLLQAFDLVWAP